MGPARSIPVALAAALALGGCFSFDRARIRDDAGGDVDAGLADAGLADAGRRDAGRADAGGPDGGSPAPDAGACTPNPEGERCDGVDDDDCDGAIDEGCECTDGTMRTCTLPACDGTQRCEAGAWSTCAPETTTPTCNGRDDDCDGTIDEGSACGTSTPCIPFRAGAGGAYLFCISNAARRAWPEARALCQSFGYDLAIIEDAAEDAALQAEADVRGNGRYWIGIDGRTSTTTWIDGSPITYTPVSISLMPNECGVLDATAGDWGSDPCETVMSRFLCEAG